MTLYLRQIWCKSVHQGLLNEWVQYIFSLYLLIPFSATYLQVRPVDGFSRLMAQTTRNTQGCAFRDLVDIVPYLWGQSPQHPIFGASVPFSSQIGQNYIRYNFEVANLIVAKCG